MAKVQWFTMGEQLISQLIVMDRVNGIITVTLKAMVKLTLS